MQRILQVAKDREQKPELRTESQPRQNQKCQKQTNVKIKNSHNKNKMKIEMAKKQNKECIFV